MRGEHPIARTVVRRKDHTRIVLMPLALLASALALAFVVWLADIRDRAHPPSDSQLNGSTAQRFPIWALQSGGSIRTFHALWRARCTRSTTWRWAVHTFRDRNDRFLRAGRGFSVSGAYDASRDRGWVPHVTDSVRGELSADRRTASGYLHGHVTWMRDGRPGATCDSGSVSWRLAAPG